MDRSSVSTTGTVVLLTTTAAFLAAAMILTLRSLRRNSALDGLAAMITVMAAGIPAAAYGGTAG
jgi:hypothetical protein